ncbi:MAG: PKD domain-containing protein [Rhodocyclaceae bacterium]|nr:PKD domain-containing protein [Rhodocyclaceae bacterium]MBX3669360.1 PKD domain-containing protein [Rhodocyclaceae bacterium]
MRQLNLGLALAGLSLTIVATHAPAAPLAAQWTRKAPLAAFLSDTNPGPRGWTNISYDSRYGRMALFGGSAGSHFINDVWHYDTLADTWTLFDKPFDECPGTFGFSAPDGRDAHSTAYDEYNGYYWTVAGGGYKCTGTKAILRTAEAGSNTTTVIDSTLPADVPVDYYKDWAIMTASQIVYVTSYDPATHTLRTATTLSGFGPGSTYRLKVYTDGGTNYFSPDTHVWGRLEGPHWGYTGPTPETGFANNTPGFAYTPVGRGFVRFGGSRNGNTINETWFLDVVSKTWTKKTNNSTTSGPPQRSEITSGMVYDSRNDVFILFGGRCVGDPRCPGSTLRGPLNDTWAYKLSTNTWTRMDPPVSPPARMAHQMAFDSDNGVVVMFGGTSVTDMYQTIPNASNTLHDLWIYDYAANTWTEVTPSLSPPGRYIGSMAYDPIAHLTVLFGGNEPGQSPQGQLWTLQLSDSTNINQPPTAVASVAPGNGTTDTVFAFDGSTSSDADGNIVSYAWSFGDGATATGATATHRYNSGGVFTVTLTVTDDRGASTSQSLTVNVAGPDTVPDPYSFTSISGAAVNTLVESNAATITGINAASPITVSGGEYSIAGGAYTSVAGTISNGQAVRVRLLTSSSGSTTRSATLTVGGVSATFSVTTGGGDTDPNAFSFTSVNNVAVATVVTSSTATIGGINAAAPISITGGSYSISNGPFTSEPGTISNGQGIRVQVQASANYATTTTAVVTIGSVSGSFSVTTAEQDITPDPVSFTPVTDAARNTLYISSSIGIWGVNAPVPISITGGEYSIGGGTYTSAAGTINKGQTVRVRQTSSPSYATKTTVVLTLGTVTVPFDVTTSGVDTTPDAFSFPAVSDALPSTPVTSAAASISGINSPAPISITGGEYSVAGGAFTAASGSITNGQSVRVRLTSSPNYQGVATATLTIGGVSSAFNVTTGAQDTTPNAFAFNQVNGAMPSTLVSSAAVTIGGINAPSPISVSGGEYSINGGAYTAANGTINNGQTVSVRLTSSAAYETPTSATLTIGGVSANFTVTTAVLDTTPSQFSFASTSGVTPGATVTSGSASIWGINGPAPISVNGGEYSINGGTFTSSDGTVSNGQTVRVRQIASSSFSTQTTAALTVGGVSAGYSVTTVAEDTTPNAFAFTSLSGQQLNKLVTSTTKTISGINAPTPISIAGGEYSINNGAFTSAPGTIMNGQGVRVRLTTSNSFSTTTSATVTVGGVSGSFDVTTVDQDTTPNAFSFTAVTNAPQNALVISSGATVWGINAPSDISVVNGEYSVAGGAYTSVAGTVVQGQAVRVRVLTSSAPSATTSATLTIGGVNANFDVTTAAQ